MLKVLLVLCCLALCEGYPHGAPLGVCESMTPNHNGNSAQTTSPPYSISVNASSYRPWDSIFVTLTANSPEKLFFEGFLIMAQRADCSSPNAPIGYFTLVPNQPAMKTINCPNANFSDNAVTHTTSSHKVSASFIWRNPDGGDVFFKYTMVNHKETFWTNIRSGTVYDVSKPKKDYTTCASMTSISVKTWAMTTVAPVHHTEEHYPSNASNPTLHLFAVFALLGRFFM